MTRTFHCEHVCVRVCVCSWAVVGRHPKEGQLLIRPWGREKTVYTLKQKPTEPTTYTIHCSSGNDLSCGERCVSMCDSEKQVRNKFLEKGPKDRGVLIEISYYKISCTVCVQCEWENALHYTKTNVCRPHNTSFFSNFSFSIIFSTLRMVVITM